MQLDIRLPIGVMFSLFGALLAGFGLLSDPQLYATHSLGVNINLYWGLVMLAFGVIMLVLALRGRKSSS